MKPQPNAIRIVNRGNASVEYAVSSVDGAAPEIRTLAPNAGGLTFNLMPDQVLVVAADLADKKMAATADVETVRSYLTSSLAADGGKLAAVAAFDRLHPQSAPAPTAAASEAKMAGKGHRHKDAPRK
jgi:hypothetical protein